MFSLSPDRELSPGLSLTLTPNVNDVIYKWQNGSSEEQYIVRSSGRYHVAVSNSCDTTSDSILIAQGSCHVYIPSAFTPNNDGLNDVFRVMGTELIEQFDLRIFDRNGMLVFQTADKGAAWNGEFKGKKMANRVYVYLLQYKENSSEKSNVLKGTITLLK